ncbi:unnamed protein product [Pipistrellus nathusii]|uniref:Uncharacterized protein n=1 Tax=Pipistrellus nathusii TaxID=59473 RepID=A0ABN9ZCW3_PIPNA
MPHDKMIGCPIRKNICTPMFIAVQFTIVKIWNSPSAKKKVGKKAEVSPAGGSVARAPAKNQSVPGSILVKGTYLACRLPTPFGVPMGGNSLMWLSHVSVYLFSPSPPSLPLSLKPMEEMASSKN